MEVELDWTADNCSDESFASIGGGVEGERSLKLDRREESAPSWALREENGRRMSTTGPGIWELCLRSDSQQRRRAIHQYLSLGLIQWLGEERPLPAHPKFICQIGHMRHFLQYDWTTALL